MSTFRMGCVVTVALAMSASLALPGCSMMPMRHKAAAQVQEPQKVVLFFHAWSADLTPDAKVIVDQAAAKIKATGPSTVAVAGYVYNDASPDENLRLAAKRVEDGPGRAGRRRHRSQAVPQHADWRARGFDGPDRRPPGGNPTDLLRRPWAFRTRWAADRENRPRRSRPACPAPGRPSTNNHRSSLPSPASRRP